MANVRGVHAWDVGSTAGEWLELLEGATLAAGTTVVVYSTDNNVVFNLYGAEYLAAELDETPKVLAQLAPGPADSVLYTVPANRRAVINLLHIANVMTGAPIIPQTFRVTIRPAGGYGVATEDFQIYDCPVNRQDAIEMLQGLTLAAGASIGVRATGAAAPNGDVTFNLYGSEVAA